MGRWGWRLFEADMDIDIACGMTQTLGFNTDDWPYSLSQMVHQTDMMAPAQARELYKTTEYLQDLENVIVPSVRARLDEQNFGAALFHAARARETCEKTRYETIILGALLMRAGAKIRPHDMQHLRDIVDHVPCHARYTWPMIDQGFRSPGKAQFKAALDNYRVGVPRNFQENSCFHCGLTAGDLGHAMSECSRCRCAWYCNRDCQRQHWPDHRPCCVSPTQRRSLNV